MMKHASLPLLGRRQFIALLGGAATAWPLTARAQQVGKLPTIGFLGANTPSSQSQWTAAFVQRLRDLGWIEGRTVAIEYRWAEDAVGAILRSRPSLFGSRSTSSLRRETQPSNLYADYRLIPVRTVSK